MPSGSKRRGEIGIGITKPGVGPNGETVVGDNERALQLFFFKHGISEPVPEPPAPVQTIVWRDGKTRITTDNAYLEISNRVQVRFTEELPDDNTQLPGTPAKGVQRPSFRIRRAKFKLEGWIMRSWLTYETQLNYPGGDRQRTPARCSRTPRSTSTSRRARARSASTPASSSRPTARRS